MIGVCYRVLSNGCQGVLKVSEAGSGVGGRRVGARTLCIFCPILVSKVSSFQKSRGEKKVQGMIDV